MVAERLVAGLVYPQSGGYAHPISGTEASVRAITRDDLLVLFRNAYRPDDAHLLVVGDVRREDVMSRAAQVFGAWSGAGSGKGTSGNGELTDNQATIYLVDRPGAPQSVIRAVHSLVPRRHPDYFPLLLANYSFGGQFSARLNHTAAMSLPRAATAQWMESTDARRSGNARRAPPRVHGSCFQLPRFRQLHSLGAHPVSR